MQIFYQLQFVLSVNMVNKWKEVLAINKIIDFGYFSNVKYSQLNEVESSKRSRVK